MRLHWTLSKCGTIQQLTEDKSYGVVRLPSRQVPSDEALDRASTWPPWRRRTSGKWQTRGRESRLDWCLPAHHAHTYTPTYPSTANHIILVVIYSTFHNLSIKSSRWRQKKNPWHASHFVNSCSNMKGQSLKYQCYWKCCELFGVPTTKSKT